MKRVFISLSLPFFLTLNYELSAYTRAELTQDKLSKIGIKQEIIDETIKFQYDMKDEKNFYTEDGEENENFTRLKEIFQKDERNDTLGTILASAYMVGEKKDFKKAREYMDKVTPYWSKFDKLSNEWTYYKLKGDEKNTKKYYNLLEKNYKGTVILDLINILDNNLDIVLFVDTLGEFLLDEGDEDLDTNDKNHANDLPDGYSYDDKKGIIKNEENDESNEDEIIEEEDNEDEMQKYSETVKEIFDIGKDTLKEQKDEIDKYQRIIDYFKIGKNQKEFGVPDDYVRGYQLKIAETKITKNMMNYGIESAVKYYLENVSTKDVTYEDVYFNEEAELAIYLSIAQMLAVADENIVNKYRKDFENTRVIKLLDKIFEGKKEKEKLEKSQKENKNYIKS
ncbi:hypothetical protein [Leptotrichia alba]|uniref:Uncharacterized protein n=1 Tax=Leptotrichia alba TaxID=3239304 RepID=A0AB39V5B2_9FUSO